MSDELWNVLRRKNAVKASVVSYHGPDVYIHDFVKFKERDKEWIADPTW